jgi:hypothetical protein
MCKIRNFQHTRTGYFRKEIHYTKWQKHNSFSAEFVKKVLNLLHGFVCTKLRAKARN